MNDYDRSVWLAENWMQTMQRNQTDLARTLGVRQPDLSKYLNLNETTYKPAPGRPAMNRLCDAILLHCSTVDGHAVRLCLWESNQLTTRFPRVHFCVVDTDNRHILYYQAAAMVDALTRSKLDANGEVSIGNTGGATIQGVFDHLHVGPRTVEGEVKCTNVNNAHWPRSDERHRRGSVELGERMAQIYSGTFLADLPIDSLDILLLSAGSRSGFTSEWLDMHNSSMPAEAVGDLAYVLLDTNGNPVRHAEATRLLSLLGPPTYLGLQTFAADAERTAMLVVTDAPYTASRDNPPMGMSKAEIVAACLKANLANSYLMDRELAQRLLVAIL